VRTSDPPPKRLALCVTSIGPRTLTLTTARSERTVDLDGEPVWVEVELDECAYDVINNVGSQLYHGGFGGDRGFLELDRGQYDTEADVFAWCGGAVLMRREYLDRVGMFDESFFLYYEDTDLSWRGGAEGWRYRYTPRSVVRHRHAQSSVVGSPTFRYYTERNRLLVLTKNAPAGVAVRAGAGEVERFGRSLVRHFVIRPMTLRMPNRAEFRHRRRVLSGYLRALPGALRQRWRRGRVVGRRELMRWAVPR
jgi:GT2 family glycosyltransferase